MSQFYEYIWPAPRIDGIDHVILGAFPNVPLKLQGYYVDDATGTVDFIKFGIVPRITIKSTQDVSSINFLITGYQNGVFISETLAGPNANTVTSVNCFDKIISIMTDKADFFEAFEIGVASVGYFPMILLNTAKTNTSSISYALNMVAAASSPATYQVFLSLKNNLGLGKYDDLTSAANGNFAAPAAAATASALLQYNSLASNLLIKIGPNNNGSVLKIQFLQL